MAHGVDEDERLHGRYVLVGVRGHPEAKERGALTGAQRRMGVQVMPAGRDRRIEVAAFIADLMQRQHEQEADRRALGIAADERAAWFAREPVLGDAASGIALVVLDHRLERGIVLRLHRGHDQPAGRLPVEEGLDDGVFAV